MIVVDLNNIADAGNDLMDTMWSMNLYILRNWYDQIVQNTLSLVLEMSVSQSTFKVVGTPIFAFFAI